MRCLFSFLCFIIVIALLVIIVGWVFATDFLIFDILLLMAITLLQIAIPLVVLIIVIWIILELFK